MARRRRRKSCCARNAGVLLLLLFVGGAAAFLASRGVPPPSGTPDQPSRKVRVAPSRSAGHAIHETPDPPSVKPAPPDLSPRSGLLELRREEISRGDPSSSEIAVTFDAGASSAPTSEILRVLKTHDVSATFFLTGKWADANSDLVRRIAADGHEIGNHSWAHRRFTGLTDGQIEEEIEETEKRVLELTGQSTKPLLRLPFGDRDSRVLALVRSLGYISVYWDIDSMDSVTPGITAADIEGNVLENVRNGSIVLLHCGSEASSAALDGLLTKLEAKGYRPVTVGRLLARLARGSH